RGSVSGRSVPGELTSSTYSPGNSVCPAASASSSAVDTERDTAATESRSTPRSPSMTRRTTWRRPTRLTVTFSRSKPASRTTGAASALTRAAWARAPAPRPCGDIALHPLGCCSTATLARRGVGPAGCAERNPDPGVPSPRRSGAGRQAAGPQSGRWTWPDGGPAGARSARRVPPAGTDAPTMVLTVAVRTGGGWSRRSVLAAGAAGAVGLLTGCAWWRPDPSPPPPDPLTPLVATATALVAAYDRT